MFKVAMSHTTTPAISSTEIDMCESPTSFCIFLTLAGYMGHIWCRRELYAGFWWGNMNEMTGKIQE